MIDEYRVAVSGAGGVGKSALTLQLVANTFIGEAYDPTIEDSYRQQMKIDNELCFLDILDTAGQEEYSSLRDEYMRHCEGFLLVYAINARSTFNEISDFSAQIDRCNEEKAYVPKVLAGNKCDMEKDRVISREEGKALAKELAFAPCKGGDFAVFYECSAKTRHNVEEAFFSVVRGIRLIRATSKKPKSHGKCLIL